MEDLETYAAVVLRREAINDALSKPSTGIAASASLVGQVATAPEAVTASQSDAAEEAELQGHAQAQAERQPPCDILANVYLDPERHHVTLLLDEQHAAAVIYAVRLLAAEYEAHAREVRSAARGFPPDSYGARNRLFVAIRHERIASRLRHVETNYRAEVSEGWG